MSTDTDSRARRARTSRSSEALPATTLLRVRLETGRTHQIRVHLQAIGHPVAGDPEYGGAGALGLERQFLHAARLAFDAPVRPASRSTLDEPAARPTSPAALALTRAGHRR